jgi:hypothetical protein
MYDEQFLPVYADPLKERMKQHVSRLLHSCILPHSSSAANMAVDQLLASPYRPADKNFASDLPDPQALLTKFSLDITHEQCQKIVSELVTESVPGGLNKESNSHRKMPSPERKELFRTELLRGLRVSWEDSNTERGFLDLATALEQHGCVVFAGLIDSTQFARLVAHFTDLMLTAGRQAFLHSFVNLAEHERFITAPGYNNAFMHPLMIALISYLMGGPIRITDIRGKDTEPIAIKAQDNMLHIDNTPFRQEFKILVGWEKGTLKGPTGQNFTFLPGTHKGNRVVRSDKDGILWSTENDSIFITDDAVDDVLAFQKTVCGTEPTVAEVNYPDHPVSIVFEAGALVHHRFRIDSGSPRSCIITAFHLVEDNPGRLVITSNSPRKSTLVDLLVGCQGTSATEFISLLSDEAKTIGKKVLELLDVSHMSKHLDIDSLKLKGPALSRWRENVINAPTASSIKHTRNVLLSMTRMYEFVPQVAARLTKVMAYDKHGMLDLILYEDGHEEVRKSARKRIWSMTPTMISQRLFHWLPLLNTLQFDHRDIKDPTALRNDSWSMSTRLLRNMFDRKSLSEENLSKLLSLQQLLVDLGESIRRCEKIETFVSTTLFLFWTMDLMLTSSEYDAELHDELEKTGIAFLRSYIATVILTEGCLARNAPLN